MCSFKLNGISLLWVLCADLLHIRIVFFYGACSRTKNRVVYYDTNIAAINVSFTLES